MKSYEYFAGESNDSNVTPDLTFKIYLQQNYQGKLYFQRKKDEASVYQLYERWVLFLWITRSSSPEQIPVRDSIRTRVKVLKGIEFLWRRLKFAFLYPRGILKLSWCVDELILTRVPLLLGSGIPLISSNGNSMVPLEHLRRLHILMG